ncbi:MAG: FGGY family carbohydrate kinase, partial [Lentisphaeria bacterium]|nr:FGGY family carbohydrate kinase [Lentisphaeria bacterium]
DHWQSFTSLLRELVAAAHGDSDIALCFAAAAGNTLLLDPQTGTPLTNIISWLDQRADSDDLPALHGLDPEKLRALTGWPIITRMALAHLAFFRKHAADILDRALVSQNQSYLLCRLTGKHLVDVSAAVPFRLVDQLNQCYDPELLRRFALRPEQLPELVPVGTFAGTLLPTAAAATGLPPGTRVYAGCFDHPAAARASCVQHEGELLLSCGTSWVGFLPCRDRLKLLAARLLIDPYLRHENGTWAGMFSIPGIGPVIDEYVHRYIAPGCPEPFRRFDELAKDHPTGACRIDLSKPYAEPNGSPGEAARALMEAAAEGLARELVRLKAHGLIFQHAVMVGGPAKSTIWPHIIAEKTGLSISVGSPAAGAIGAASIALAATQTQ